VNADWTAYNHSFTDKVGTNGDPNPNSQIGTGTAGNYPGAFVSPFWIAKLFHPAGLVNTGEAYWSVQLDYLDGDLGRKFHLSRNLVIRPFIGLRSACIDQTYRLKFLKYNWPSDPETISRDLYVKMKNNMWGIGGRGGFNANWILGKGVSICSRFSFSMLYGKFDLSYYLRDRHPIEEIFDSTGLFVPVGPGIEVQQALSPYDNSFRVSNHLHSTVYMADLFLGLCFEKAFHNDSYHFTAYLGYEQGVSFQQNRFINPQYDFTLISASPALARFNSEGPNFFTDRGSMTTSGASGGVNLSF
jgi:hypothetical protein